MSGVWLEVECDHCGEEGKCFAFGAWDPEAEEAKIEAQCAFGATPEDDEPVLILCTGCLQGAIDAIRTA